MKRRIQFDIAGFPIDRSIRSSADRRSPANVQIIAAGNDLEFVRSLPDLTKVEVLTANAHWVDWKNDWELAILLQE